MRSKDVDALLAAYAPEGQGGDVVPRDRRLRQAGGRVEGHAPAQLGAARHEDPRGPARPHSLKFWNESGMPSAALRTACMTACRSSFFLPVMRTASPWI